jgi:hypothetical protein
MKTCLLALIVLHLGLAAVVAQPVITNQPQSQTAIAGATVVFSVGATGAPPLSYQWVFRTLSNRLPGATNNTLILPNVQASNAGIYRVVITNDAGSVQSASAVLTVLAPPIITRQPVSQLAEVGDPVAISVTATGTPPLSYQWQFEGQTLLGQMRSNVAWTSVQLSNAGPYSVVITNSAGSITSQVATLAFVPSVFSKITTGNIVNDGGFSFSCAWGDYNNDGWVDLFVANDFLVNGSRVENNNANDFLYRNNGDGTFTRVTNVAVAQDTFWSISGAWGDYDNDGHLDLFVGYPGHPNALFRNRGDGTFAKITTGVIVTESQTSHAAVWGDFDRDGWIDMFIANFWDTPPPPLPNVLYRNLGDGSFSKISFGPKPANSIYSWNVAWGDFNNDSWPDLFVPQGGTHVPERDQNGLLYLNTRDGSFALLTNSVVYNTRANGVACAWGDYDNDGFLDLFVSNFYGQNNFLYHNNGDGTFAPVTNSIVTVDGGTSVGCAWGDYDNDGWLDLFVANLGPVSPNGGSIAPENNFLYHNNGDGTFTKVTSGRLVNDLGYSTGCAWADYDNDGFLDLAVANGWVTRSENNFLYHNNGNTNNWINFRLVGTASNRSAIGAKVRVLATVGGRTIWQMREISGGSNYGSQNDMRANFGLGEATNVDTVRIEWPSGTVQDLHNVAARQFLTITEPPRLLASNTNGVPQFALKGGRGFNYQIDTSTNLADWSLLGTVTITNSNGTAPITDTNAPDARGRFYRAVQP